MGSIGAGAWVVYLAAGKGSRTLYPVDASGLPDITQPGVIAPLGMAVYVAGAGAAIALIGSFITRFGALRVFDLLLAGSERHPGY